MSPYARAALYLAIAGLRVYKAKKEADRLVYRKAVDDHIAKMTEHQEHYDRQVHESVPISWNQLREPVRALPDDHWFDGSVHRLRGEDGWYRLVPLGGGRWATEDHLDESVS